MNKALIIAVVLVGVFTGFAAGSGFEDRGWILEGKSQDGPLTVYNLKDKAGLPVAVALQGEPKAYHYQVLEGLYATFSKMKILEIASIRIAFVNNRAEVILIPANFPYKGKNLARFLPSGIQFYYTDFLEFDFRMVVENLFLRLKGQYFTEEQFAEKLFNASENPYAYIQSQDPEYIILRFQEIMRLLDALKVEGSRAETEAAARIDSIRGSLEKNIGGLRVDVENLVKKQQAAGEKVDKLTQEFVLLRYALLVLNNRGFFGSINLPSEEAVAKLVEMKTNEPGLTMKEAQARLKTAGVEMTSKEVFLVFSVYFNEFE
jgi:hypothetical protein